MAYQAIPPRSGADAWITSQNSLLRSAVPSLTRFQEIKAGLYPFGTATATADDFDSLQVGGGTGNGAAAYSVFGTSIFQTPKTTAWGICFRCILTAPANTKFYSVGLVNGAGNHDVAIVSLFATSATNNVLEITGGATTLVTASVAAVSTIADYCLTSDTVTIKAWRDNSVIASTTTYTNLADEPMFPAIWGTDANTVKVVRMYYGYIGP